MIFGKGKSVRSWVKVARLMDSKLERLKLDGHIQGWTVKYTERSPQRNMVSFDGSEFEIHKVDPG